MAKLKVKLEELHPNHQEPISHYEGKSYVFLRFLSYYKINENECYQGWYCFDEPFAFLDIF